jgi:16S rRNA (guanine527-N7)-methyltransferase
MPLSETTAAAVETVGRQHRLGAAQLRQLQRLLERLVEDLEAPTSVRDPAEAVDVHLADSLAGLEIAELHAARSLVDIGSGAGLPGLALAVALPACEVVLLESQTRKCAFLETASVHLGAGNATVVCARAEDWTAGRDVHDVAVARAIAPQPVVLEYAAPLLRTGGLLVDWRGMRSRDDEAHAARAAAELGLSLREIRHVVPFPTAHSHHLHVFEKIAPTPGRFPRRAGMARKRPLGT